MALAMSGVFGVALILLGVVATPWVASSMGASREVFVESVAYIRIRLIGAPAVLISMVIFGAMRGLQDMRTPLWISVGINVVNIALDPLLIFGAGPIPALGIEGAAWASIVSQWLGAGAAVWVLYRSTGMPSPGLVRYEEAVSYWG